MRKIKFSYWIPAEYVAAEGKSNQLVSGTCVWSDKQDGYFHTWGSESHEDSNGNMVESVAIVEDAQGKIFTTLPRQIQFMAAPEDIELSYTTSGGVVPIVLFSKDQDA